MLSISTEIRCSASESIRSKNWRIWLPSLHRWATVSSPFFKYNLKLRNCQGEVESFEWHWEHRSPGSGYRNSRNRKSQPAQPHSRTPRVWGRRTQQISGLWLSDLRLYSQRLQNILSVPKECGYVVSQKDQRNSVRLAHNMNSLFHLPDYFYMDFRKMFQEIKIKNIN